MIRDVELSSFLVLERPLLVVEKIDPDSDGCCDDSKRQCVKHGHKTFKATYC